MKQTKSTRPLLIALHTDYFVQFKTGTKTREYRLYGPRWNERTCYPGRPAVVRAGYSSHHQLRMQIIGFCVLPFNQAPDEARAIYYKHPTKKIACIHLAPEL